MTPQASQSRTEQDATAARLEELRPGLRLLALRSLGSSDAAEEAVQETLARAVVAVGKGQPADPAKLPAFVAGIARHVIADAQRARHRVVSLEGVPASAHPVADDDALAALVSRAERERLRAALTQLAPADRDLLRLCYVEGLTSAEIAGRLREPPERIRKRKSRALERLRCAFQGEAGHTLVSPPTEEAEPRETKP